MTELGRLLELLHDAHTNVTTVQASYREFIRLRPSVELVVERTRSGEFRTRWRGPGPFPKPFATTRHLWLALPTSLRVEVIADGVLIRLGVRNDNRWWRWGYDDGAVTSEKPADHRIAWSMPPLLSPPLLDPVRLLTPLRFQYVGTGSRAQRRVIRARAWPRHAPSPEDLPQEFEFDAEHGTILRRATLEGDDLVSVIEATDVAYNAPIDEDRFKFISPDGQPARHIEPTDMTDTAPSHPGGAPRRGT